MHPHHHLPRRTLQDALRRRVRDRRLGRLVQQPAPPQLTGHDPPGRVRGAPLRGPQPRARPRKVAAENPGRFRSGCLVSKRWWFGVGWWVGVVVVGEALLEFFPCGGEGVDEPGGDEVAFVEGASGWAVAAWPCGGA